MYTYNARVLAVHDGDTVTLEIDLGLNISQWGIIRLYGPDPLAPMGLNSPELNTEAGRVAQKFLADLLAAHGNQVIVRTVKDKKEKFGRWLGVLMVTDAMQLINVNQALLDNGNAKLEKY